ncbi:class I SAM-dependent methyltransferase [Streptomyces monticola]|uniref:Class I SAM-dependent methyltransferase n=1 Tax=Streptomyces monticola TaxID=2666263 RepID=A0ABW2JD87_9ACTN
MGDHQHGHHHDPTHIDWEAMSETLERRAEIYAPLTAQIIERLRAVRPEPRRIVDAGSGPGVISCALAEAFPQAEVVAVDGAGALLERATARAGRMGVGSRLRTCLADLPEGFAEAGEADVIWLGLALHHIGDQRAALAECARHLVPGGALVLLEGGLPARHLPRDIGIGRPGLQARLDAANEEAFTAMRAALPGAKDEVEDWAALLTAAGLTHVGTRTHLLDLPGPVPEQVRAHVVAVTTRLRDVAADQLSPDDLATLDRLLDPSDKESLHHRPDVFLLATQTVHLATKA